MMADGLLSVCKECHKANVRRHRRESPRPREYDRERAKLPARRKHMSAVAAKWRRDNPVGDRAHNAVNNAIRDGKLAKGSRCSIRGCKRTDLHAHHKDYSKPLDVTWLCALHHHRLKAKDQGATP
jgi:hypothetical protein